MNKNFLNNQNYILGKTEKKKLLSKFFVEKNIKIFYKIISYLKYILTFLLLLLLLFFLSKNDREGVIIGNFILFIGYIFLNIKNQNYSLKINKISNLKDFIFIKSFILYFFNFLKILLSKENLSIEKIKNFNNTKNKLPLYFSFLNIFIYSISVIYLLIYFLINSNIDLELTILIVSFVLGLSNFINIFSILLLPFFILIIILVLFFSFIYTFILKGTIKYYFIKYSPNSKFLTKFKKLEKNCAENEYYRLEIKK